MERIREMYDESYLDLCIEGLYDLMKLKEVIFRYRINYKKYNLYGRHTYLEEKYSHMDFDDYFVRKFNSIYDKYAEIIEQNKGYNNETEMSSVIKAIRSILVLYSSLVENKEFERIFYQRVMSFEPLLILVNVMKSEFQTILFGYAETANSAHSPVIGTQVSSNEIDLNEPEVTNEFSYPEVRTLDTFGYRYRTQLLPKSGEIIYQLEATNVLPLHLELRKRNRSKKMPRFRKPTKANKNTQKLKEIIKERKSKHLSPVKKESRKVKNIKMKRLGMKI
jgi:hypothetical protein